MQNHLLKVDLELHARSFIDSSATLFDAGPLNKELEKYIADKPGDKKWVN